MDRSGDGAGDRIGLTRALAAHGASLNFDRLPADVITRAKHSILDWVGVTLAGWSDPLVAPLVGFADAEGGAAVSTLLGLGRRSSASQAALINGAASHALDFDDVHLLSRVHPSAPVLPAVLALAERDGLGGRALILSFVAGVEMQSSLGALLGNAHYRRGWHNTATLGAFGAAAACGRLLDLSTEQVQHALGIVATQAAGLRAVFGTMCKPFQTGRAAANGIMAADLARAGLTSRTDIFECAVGFAEIAGEQDFDIRTTAMAHALERAADRDDFHTRSIILKYHASCYGTHAPIEAALRLRDRLDGAAPEAVEVVVEPQYMSVCNIATPHDPLEAKFSLRHTVALALLGRDLTDGSGFALAAIDDPQVAGLRDRTTVTSDSGMRRACAQVSVRLRDGRNLVMESDASRAELDLTRQARRVEAKFRALAEPHLGRARADELVGVCRELERVEDIASLTGLFMVRRDFR